MGLSNLFTDRKLGAGSGQMKAAPAWLLMLLAFVFLAKSVWLCRLSENIVISGHLVEG